jgi:hypothetical protein
MAHRIDIRLGDFTEDEHHKVRNFIEALWLEISNRGWAEMQNFDHRVNPEATFHFVFPARDSHEASNLVRRLAQQHFMTTLIEVTHAKKAPADG